jgi:flagella basal body P-ring formation protein FlgA
LAHCFCGIVLLVCGGIAIGMPTGVDVRVELQSDVTVSGPRLRLIDVATVHAADPALEAVLQQTALGVAPRVGAITRLTRRDLEHLLRSVRLEQGLTFAWSGATAVNIRSAQQTVAAAKAIEIARMGLSKALLARFQQVDLMAASPMTDLVLPLGQVEIRLRPVDVNQITARMPVWLDVYVDGLFYCALSPVFAVRASQPGYVARHDLAVGTQASVIDFEQRLVDVAVNLQGVMPSGQVQDGMAVRKQIVAGQTLLRNQLADAGMVLRGDLVALQLAQGGVVIETRAVVQEDAVLGQLVKVKPEHGNGMVLARVRSSGLVQLE